MVGPDVRIRPVGGRILIWNEANGRHLVLDAGALDAPSDALRARLRRMGMIGAVDVPSRIPARSLLPIVVDGVLWAPDPTLPSPGGLPWRPIGTEPWQVALWRRLGEVATVGRVIEDPRALGFLRRLCAIDVQALQLRDEPVPARDPSLSRVWSPPRPAHTLDGRTLAAWHAQIDDAPTHFDDTETTIAWTFGVPHPALQGRPYGRALRDALGDHVRGRIVEVGCGSGEVARDFGVRPYLRLDLSPALLAEQARTAPDTEGRLGDATALPLADGSVDLLISNEVIADLPWEHDGARIVTTGAFQFVREIARVLAPGGVAWLSEFGGDELPEIAEQLDHPEVSIHFGELAEVATAAGLHVDRMPLASFLGMDTQARWLWRPHWEAVRAVARARGVHLQARACPTLPFAVEGLREVPLTEEGPGPLPARFEALLLRKPRAGA